MNLNLDNLGSFVLAKLLFIGSNFIDDLCCLLLFHLGIHLPWLQLLSSILIVSKIIYAISRSRVASSIAKGLQNLIAKLIIDYDQKQQLQNYLRI